MLRGSTDLLQYTYKVHVPVVHELYDFYKNKIPFAYNFDKKSDKEYLEKLKKESETVFDFCSEKLFPIYKEIHGRYVWDQKTYDTLTTKILLGVFGITPAYDKNLKKGISKESTITQKFNKKSIESLCDFYLKYIDSFNKIKDPDLFPPMKLIDMYFWQKGFNIIKDEKEKKNKQNKTT
ncbi:MAG: hypothetical protein ACRCTJ_01165 [Brevinema sp.]